jgi:hypothetical protein
MSRETADELNISFGTCQVTMTPDLGMRCKPYFSASHTRSDKTVTNSVHKLLRCAKNDITILPSITTEDETWVYGYNQHKTNAITMEDATVILAEESKASLVKKSRQC